MAYLSDLRRSLTGRHSRALRLSLGTRIVVGVTLGVLLILLLYGVVAWTIVNQALDAAAREQEVVATTEANQIGATLSADPGSAVPSVRRAVLQQFLDRTTPPDVSIQVITSSGQVLAQRGDTSPAMIAEHVALLRSFIDTEHIGYRVHRPDPGEHFTPHIVAYAPVPGQPTLGVFVQQSQTTILAAPEQLLRLLIVAGLFALGLAVAIAWLDVNRVIRPLRALTNVAERFAAGNLSEPVVLDRGDEVGTLAHSFESMRQRLRQSLAEIESWNQELERRVERRTHDLAQRNRQLSTINAVAESLVTPLRVEDLFERTFPLISEATGFEVVSYRLFDNDESPPPCAGRNAPPGQATEAVPGGQCLCRQAAELRRPVDRGGPDQDPAVCDRSLAGRPSLVAIPLCSVERVEGVLFLGATEVRSVTPADRETFAAIGRQIGMAIANARLYRALRQREQERAALLDQILDAQEEERRRVSQELYDDLCQALSTVLLGLEGVMNAEHSATPASTRIAMLQSLVTATLESAHRLATDLRPSVLDDLGLVVALERLVDVHRPELGQFVEFQAINVAQLRLVSAAECALYRIAQAALSNVAHHAAAQTVSVLLQRRADRLILVVEDDGRGFDLATVRAAPLKDRLGLAGIDERARLIGAHLTIESTPGRGTTLFVDVPIANNDAAASGAEPIASAPSR